jgi:predicted nucleic acid-binding protein
VIVLDTSGIVAAYNTREKEHKAARQVLLATDEPMVISPLVLAEIDYLATKYLGPDGSATVLREIDRLASVASFGNEDLRTCMAILERYRDLDIGLTDAANVDLAARYKTTRILSLDRHYRAVRPLQRSAFDLLPGLRPNGSA